MAVKPKPNVQQFIVGARQILQGLGLLLLGSATVFAEGEARRPAETTPQFAFYSDFATNLNDALIVAGTARNDGEPELFRSGVEQTCFNGLPSSLRAGWDRAVDYYAEIVSPVNWNDRQQFLLRLDLAGIEDEFDERALRFIAMSKIFRAAAKPAYEECRWPVQDAENRGWIDKLTVDLDAYEATIASRLERLYGTSWHGLPLQVDVVADAPPLGANSIFLTPSGGHILVSSSIEANFALEIVFHEASHTIASSRRNDPLPRALEKSAREHEMPLPRDLWHVVLFYLTGDTVRRTLEDAGGTGYVPYMYAQGLWNGRWDRYRSAVEKALPAYIDGEVTLAAATSDLIAALHGTGEGAE